MTDEEATTLRTRAKRAALKMGVPMERAEELAQDVVLRFIQHGKGQTVSQALVDAMRGTDGRKTSVNAETRHALNHTAPIEDAPEPSAETNPTVPLEIEERLANLTRSERAMYMLSKRNEFTHDEIADLFGLTGSRVTQVLTEAQRKLGESPPVPVRPKPRDKNCCVCKKTLPIADFYLCRTNRDGYASKCKTCDKKQARDRRKKYASLNSRV